MNDPTNWNQDGDSIKVGDTFTEKWLDRFRELMASHNALKAALTVFAFGTTKDGAEEERLCWCAHPFLPEHTATCKQCRAAFYGTQT